MKGETVRHIIKRFFCWVLLLQMINLSINLADFREFQNRHASHKAAQPFNEIETLYELVAEGLFDKDIPDTEDQDTVSSFKSFDLFSFQPLHNEIVVTPYTVEYFSFYQPGISLVHAEPNAPPPKQA